MEGFSSSNLGSKLSKLKNKAALAASLAMPIAGPIKATESLTPPPAAESFIGDPTQGPLDYPTRRLAGHKLGDEYTLYTGIKGEVPETVRINFSHQLKLLTDLKVKISPGNKVVAEEARILNQEYKDNPVHHMTYDDYVSHIDQVIKRNKDNADFWKKVAEIKNLSAVEAKLAETICKFIDGKVMASYMMAELMPTEDGALNKEVMDFLTRNAGKEYIESIPAVHDDKSSFGTYQLTEYAVYDGPEIDKNGKVGKKRILRGASIINQALPANERIPGSVSHLRGDQQHLAAYYFNVDNVANFVKMASRINKLNVLETILKDKRLEIIQIVATASHGPNAVIEGVPSSKGHIPGMAELWLKNDGRNHFLTYTRGNYAAYARKTKANYEALEHHTEVSFKGIPEVRPEHTRVVRAHEATLQGSKKALDEANATAQRLGLTKMEEDEDVIRMTKQGSLIKMDMKGDGFYLDEMGAGYPGKREILNVTRPWVKVFIEKEGKLFAKAFPGVKFKVTALTRSNKFQKWLEGHNSNASKRSVHPTGSVVDISKLLTPSRGGEVKPMSKEELEYMRRRLLELEREGKILAVEEFKQATFHIFVLPDYASKTP